MPSGAAKTEIPGPMANKSTGDVEPMILTKSQQDLISNGDEKRGWHLLKPKTAGFPFGLCVIGMIIEIINDGVTAQAILWVVVGAGFLVGLPEPRRRWVTAAQWLRWSGLIALVVAWFRF